MNNEQPIIACTHCGLFHADEIMACALLRLAAGSSHVAIIRSRLAKDWERADYVLDVGGKYDGVKFFDHHQAGFNEKREDGTGYSTFGLLWKAIGVTMLRELLLPYKLEDLMIAEVAEDMENFVKGIDLHDQSQLNVNARWSLNKAIYAEILTLQAMISSLNPVPFIDKSDTITSNQQFYLALDFAVLLLRRLVFRKASRVIAKKYVATRIKPDQHILYLEEYCDWYDVVSSQKHILYVIYPSSNGKAFVVQAVKANSGSSNVNNLKLPFPAQWGGLSDEALAKVCNIPEALFCHRDRFIASASTLVGAYSIAQNSINLQQNESAKYGYGTQTERVTSSNASS